MASAALIIPSTQDPAERLQQAGMVRRARYVGFLRGQDQPEVWVCTLQGLTRLFPRHELISALPIAFRWGVPDAGCLHLAVAVLSHWAGADEFALRYYRAFTDEVIVHLTQRSWELTNSAIVHAIARITVKQKHGSGQGAGK